MAKDCKLTIKCSECGSDKHLAALHVERPGKPKSPAETQGGEQSNGQQDGKDETVKPRSEDPMQSYNNVMYRDMWLHTRR